MGIQGISVASLPTNAVQVDKDGRPPVSLDPNRVEEAKKHLSLDDLYFMRELINTAIYDLEREKGGA